MIEPCNPPTPRSGIGVMMKSHVVLLPVARSIGEATERAATDARTRRDLRENISVDSSSKKGMACY